MKHTHLPEGMVGSVIAKEGGLGESLGKHYQRLTTPGYETAAKASMRNAVRQVVVASNFSGSTEEGR
jgi:hypothetical protein